MAELKYYAKPVDPEFYNYEHYYDEYDAQYDNFWAGDNRNYTDVNHDLVNDVRRALVDCNYDIIQVFDYDNVTEEERLDDIQKTLRSYFKREDGNQLTNKQLSKLFKIIMDSDGEYSLDDVCQVLEIIYGEPFKHGQIHGNSQGDWMYFVCPASLSQERLDYIEAVLFATGTEFAVTGEKIDDPSKFEEADKTLYYTAKWTKDEIKKDLAYQSYRKPDEIEILEED